jgi:hypothetical protein
MPVGNPIYLEGDISIDKKPFGFFEVKVTTPKNLKYPILPTRKKIDGVFKTIYPLGKWKGVYFSEEIYNAMKYGYKFEFLRGYVFDKAEIFKEFVDNLYEMKSNSEKGSPDYIISKLLLNSLYGRFGMSPYKEKHIILSSGEASEYYQKYRVTNVIPLKNINKEIISYIDDITIKHRDYSPKMNISVPIASAVTAYGRMHMSYYKMMCERLGIILFYSDTDSLYLDKALDNKYIGKGLGQLKLEHIFDKAIFLSSKSYGGITSNYETIKIKGLKEKIGFNELIPLLHKNEKLIKNQDKWYKNVSAQIIEVKNEPYTLIVNESKRRLLYNKNDELIDTLPLYINEENENENNGG